MSENTVINVNSNPEGGSTSVSSLLTKILSIGLVIALIIGLIIFLGITYLIVDNWEAIVTFFTTGFIGWLNPFDDSSDDNSYYNDETAPYWRNLPLIGPFIRIFG